MKQIDVNTSGAGMLGCWVVTANTDTLANRRLITARSALATKHGPPSTMPLWSYPV
jgi:hypothetical protein